MNFNVGGVKKLFGKHKEKLQELKSTYQVFLTTFKIAHQRVLNTSCESKTLNIETVEAENKEQQRTKEPKKSEQKQTYNDNVSPSQKTTNQDLVSAELVKSEVNLLTLPFFALSKKVSKQKTKTEYKDVIRRNNKKIEILWRVTSNSEYGYPTSFDKRIYKAIEQLINERNFQLENPIPFTFYQLCKVIGVKNNGRVKRDIKDGLLRIVTATIESKSTFYLKGIEEYLLHKAFHLYEEIIFKNEKMPDGSVAETNYLYLGRFYLESLNSFYVKTIDFKYYQSLKSDIACRLYEMLDVRFYGLKKSKRNYIWFEYKKLCELLPVTQQRYFSDATRYLQPAHDKLVKTGFLEKFEWMDLTKSSDWEIRYFPSEATMRRQVASQSTKYQEMVFEDIPQIEPLITVNSQKSKLKVNAKEKNKGKSVEPTEPIKAVEGEEYKNLADGLIKQGITKSRIPKLIVEYRNNFPDGDLWDVIECFDYRNKNKEFETAKNKAGLLVTMIKENNCEAEGYISRVDRETKTAALKPQEPLRDIPNQVKNSWNDALKTLQSDMEKKTFNTYLSGLVLMDYNDDGFIVFDEYAETNLGLKYTIENTYFPELEKVAGKRVRFL